MNQSKKMTKLAIAALEDKKANDVRVIYIAGVSVIADYFVIASGSNTNQVQAMADSVREALGIAGYGPRQIEGYGVANWILMDYNDIIVHIFSDESRTFYDLERIWRDGKEVSVGEFETERISRQLTSDDRKTDVSWRLIAVMQAVSKTENKI